MLTTASRLAALGGALTGDLKSSTGGPLASVTDWHVRAVDVQHPWHYRPLFQTVTDAWFTSH